MVKSLVIHNNEGGLFYSCVGAFILFASMFGPKVGGWIDVSVIVPAIFWCLFLVFDKDLKIDKRSNLCISIISTLFIYIVLITLLKESTDFFSILRNLRSLLSSFFLTFIFYKLTSSGLISIKNFIWIILCVIFILAIVVLIQILWPSSQFFFADIYGFNKGLRAYRAFGLTSGYDTAGYLLVFLAVSAMTVNVLSKSWIAICISIISSIAVLFTSRSSMVLMLLFFCLTFFSLIFKFRVKLYRLLPYFIVILSSFILYIGNILTESIGFLKNSNSFVKYSFQVNSQYAQMKDASGYLTMYFLPEDFLDLLFGTGYNTGFSDVGYIQIIFMGGLFFLFLILFFYLKLYFESKKAIKKIIETNKNNDWEIVALNYMIFVLFLMLFLSNFKNLYFLTRGYHELIVVMSVSSFGFLAKNNKDNIYV